MRPPTSNRSSSVRSRSSSIRPAPRFKCACLTTCRSFGSTATPSSVWWQTCFRTHASTLRRAAGSPSEQAWWRTLSRSTFETRASASPPTPCPMCSADSFAFTIPLARDASQSGDVLVVEDDAGFAHLLQAELTGLGVSSIWAADAETAERLMIKKKARAVVLDLLLPGLQGEAYLDRLRVKHGSGIPVVVVTLKDLEPAETLLLHKAGVTAILRKGPGMAETAANMIAKSLAAEQLVAG